ncbi:hypothetical protein DNI29_05030 [Hymenobacter sediminis]|uniref:hypothetical protein n=1 Tax=Hymenobacter sediminis TaxID=2218621 RepID=UPI000DA6CCF6|nr:hypothetical protein [Hymenobacter sediminis]RPD50162.1 hypothetical protein DNI29_05030 [Hymenobacter sediminis]
MKVSRQHALLYLLFFVMLLVLSPRAGLDGDVGCWRGWASYIFTNGLENTYQTPGINYNPFYMYVLWLYGKMAGSVAKIEYYCHQLKGFTLLFDIGGAILASRLVAGRERQFMLSLLLLFNIGYVYNTMIWEQVDAILAFFAFASVLVALRGNTAGSLMLFILAINTKAQGIVFLPPLLVLWIGEWVRRPRQLPIALGAAAALQVAILSPFLWGGEQNTGARILEINIGTVGLYPVVSMNAYNVWVLIFQEKALMNIYSISDDLEAAGLTYRQWGLVMFMVASAITLLPLLILVVRNSLARRRYTSMDQALVLLCCGMVPLLFTYFNTQMHERYWHPAILFLAGSAFLTRRYWLYIVASIAYFLQLEAVLRYLMLRKYSILFFDINFITGLFTLCIIGGIWEVYRLARVKGLVSEIRLILRSPKAPATLVQA